MYLHRQRCAHIEEFKQQWEPIDDSVPISQHPIWPVMHQLAKRDPFEWTICDHTGMLVAIAQNPSFADRVLTGQCERQHVGQPSSTPGPILEKRIESQRIERGWIQLSGN